MYMILRWQDGDSCIKPVNNIDGSIRVFASFYVANEFVNLAKVGDNMRIISTETVYK